MPVSQKILKLDISTEQSYVYLKCKQYDSNSRVYQIIPTDRHIPLVLNGDELVIAGMTKSDNAYADTVCEWIDGKLYLTMTDSMLATSGEGILEIRIFAADNATVVSSMIVHVDVQASSMPYDRMIASNEFNALNHLLLSIQANIDYMTQADELIKQIQKDIDDYKAEYSQLSTEAQSLITDLETLIGTVETQEQSRQTAEENRNTTFSEKMTTVDGKLNEIDISLTNSETALENANKANTTAEETIEKLNEAIDGLQNVQPSILSSTKPTSQEIGGLWFVEDVATNKVTSVAEKVANNGDDNDYRHVNIGSADSVIVDVTLSEISENPVQNKVITSALALKGSTLFYDEENSKLQLKSGDNVISEVEIVGGGDTISTINVTTSEFQGQEITLSLAGGDTVISTFSDDGVCFFKVKELGVYTVTCGEVSETVTVSVYGALYTVELSSAPKATINVTTTASELFGQTVTCEGGGETLTSVFSESGECSFKVSNVATYTIACGDYSTTVEITDLERTYSAVIQIGQTVDELLEVAESFTFVCNGVELYDEPIVWQFLKRNHTGYPENSLLCATKQIIKIMAFDAAEPNNSNASIAGSGNHRYSYSNVRQWLNSEKSGGEWYMAQHSADAPPTADNLRLNVGEYESEDGFLCNMPQGFIDLLLDTTLRCAYISNDDTSTILYEDVTDKVFLASVTESILDSSAGANTNVKTGEGTRYFDDKPLYQHWSPKATEACLAHANVTSGSISAWTRTMGGICSTCLHGGWIYESYCNSIYMANVSNDAAGVQNDLTKARGIAPFINLSADAKFSLEPNADGHYELLL